jgi:hypothetical protein
MANPGSQHAQRIDAIDHDPSASVIPHRIERYPQVTPHGNHGPPSTIRRHGYESSGNGLHQVSAEVYNRTLADINTDSCAPTPLTSDRTLYLLPPGGFTPLTFFHGFRPMTTAGPPPSSRRSSPRRYRPHLADGTKRRSLGPCGSPQHVAARCLADHPRACLSALTIRLANGEMELFAAGDLRILPHVVTRDFLPQRQNREMWTRGSTHGRQRRLTQNRLRVLRSP